MLFAACSGGGDDQQKAKLATDLVQCRNDLTNLKEQLAEVQGAAARRRRRPRRVCCAPIDLKAANAGQKHMEGNIAPEAVVKVVKQNSGGLARLLREGAQAQARPAVRLGGDCDASRWPTRGTAQGGDVSRRTPMPEMERCMASTMEKWKFPAFQGDPVAFEQPVNLVAK